MSIPVRTLSSPLVSSSENFIYMVCHTVYSAPIVALNFFTRTFCNSYWNWKSEKNFSLLGNPHLCNIFCDLASVNSCAWRFMFMQFVEQLLAYKIQVNVSVSFIGCHLCIYVTFQRRFHRFLLPQSDISVCGFHVTKSYIRIPDVIAESMWLVHRSSISSRQLNCERIRGVSWQRRGDKMPWICGH